MVCDMYKDHSGLHMTSLVCELWITISTERFWQIYAGPHLSSLGRIFRCGHDNGTQ